MKIKVLVALMAVAVFSVAAVAQDDCATAVAATCNGAGAALDPNTDTTPTGPLGSCTGGGGVNDVWATFVATDTSARLRTDLNSTGTDSNFIVYAVDQLDQCNAGLWTEVGCSEDDDGAGGFLGDICIDGLTVGDTYVVQFGSYGDVGGSYVLDVECPATGATCGDGVTSCIPGDEECDGADDAACDIGCLPDCTCENLPFPALPVWGLVGLVAMLLGGGAVVFRRK
jgi:hypothetical protein